MPFIRKRPLIILNREEKSYLQELSRSRTETAQRVERSKIILLYSEGAVVVVSHLE
ncbi:transposase and inactivated derivative [Candidatus Scalindua japonica]|uniref:Transposase and inactivated derivative n=1 Tax=Candidatus Scalindua japonica TaxID=1284222 RepID=A0A286TZA0_9BACT|nr:transposase and inactivated derivative [Candidatus Scalindua japonica]